MIFSQEAASKCNAIALSHWRLGRGGDKHWLFEPTQQEPHSHLLNHFWIDNAIAALNCFYNWNVKICWLHFSTENLLFAFFYWVDSNCSVCLSSLFHTHTHITMMSLNVFQSISSDILFSNGTKFFSLLIFPSHHSLTLNENMILTIFTTKCCQMNLMMTFDCEDRDSPAWKLSQLPSNFVQTRVVAINIDALQQTNYAVCFSWKGFPLIFHVSQELSKSTHCLQKWRPWTFPLLIALLSILFHVKSMWLQETDRRRNAKGS